MIEKLKTVLAALEGTIPRLAPYGEQDWLDAKKAITDLRSVIAEMEAGEPVNESLAQEIECIDLRYRGDPSYEHDGYYIRRRAAAKVRNGYAIYLHPQPKQPLSVLQSKTRS